MRVKQERAEFPDYMYEEGLREHRIYDDEMGLIYIRAELLGELPEDKEFIGLLEDNEATTSPSLLQSPIQVD